MAKLTQTEGTPPHQLHPSTSDLIAILVIAAIPVLLVALSVAADILNGLKPFHTK